MIFPFRPFEVDPNPAYPSGVIHRPVIPVWVSAGDRPVPLFGLVDTGADDTKMPRSVADRLGASLDLDHPTVFRGLGGFAVGHYGDVVLELRQSPKVYRWAARVAFLRDRDDDDPSDRVTITLGHAGFLRHFHTSFDFQRGRLRIRPNRLFQGIAP